MFIINMKLILFIMNMSLKLYKRIDIHDQTFGYKFLGGSHEHYIIYWFHDEFYCISEYGHTL